jgi:electron transfer flavoprotein beta subunit
MSNKSHFTDGHMKIIVCIKQVPGTTKVEIDGETGVLMRGGADAKLNPYDLYAVETALRLREEYGGTVTAVSMGPPQAEAVLREAFAMGADAGFLLSDRAFAGADVLATSYALSQGIEHIGAFELIICGKQTTDGDTAQVGPEIAERLDIPHVSNAVEIHKAGEGAIWLTADTGTCLERLEIALPCLITVEKDIYTPRLPSYKRGLETRSREIAVMTLNNLADADPAHYGLNGSPTRVERVYPPEGRAGREIHEGGDAAASLFNRLTELKTI